MVEDALIHRAERLVAASYYGSVVLSKLSSAPNLWAEAVRTEFSTQLLSTTAALPAAVFIARLQHVPTALSPANLPGWAAAARTGAASTQRRWQCPGNARHGHLS